MVAITAIEIGFREIIDRFDEASIRRTSANGATLSSAHRSDSRLCSLDRQRMGKDLGDADTVYW